MSHALPIPRRRQHGRTLLELMIAIAIGLVILLALGTVYLGTTRTNRQAGSVSRMSEDAAIAFSIMGSSLRMAGYSTPRALVLPGGGTDRRRQAGCAGPQLHRRRGTRLRPWLRQCGGHFRHPRLPDGRHHAAGRGRGALRG